MSKHLSSYTLYQRVDSSQPPFYLPPSPSNGLDSCQQRSELRGRPLALYIQGDHDMQKPLTFTLSKQKGRHFTGLPSIRFKPKF